MDDLKKGYKPLIIMFAALFLFPYGFSFLSDKVKLLVFLLTNFFFLWLIGLFILIHKTERVYYITGISFKQAKEATSLERQTYALRHFKVFTWAGIIYLLYSFLSYLAQISFAVDILIFSLLIIVGAIKTVPLKLIEK